MSQMQAFCQPVGRWQATRPGLQGLAGGQSHAGGG